MTATRPAPRYNVNQSNNNSNNVNVLAKRTRGPINKRACQRCRQGKIKCDGDAETGKACSNCDPQHCKYDNSPRKNKQVESLKLRLNAVEEQLIAITSDVSEQLQTKDIEKEILCLLYESKEHFVTYEQLFKDLRDALKQSRCIRPVLPITFELLKRLGEGKCIPEIMRSLQRFVDCASDTQIMPAFPSTDMFKKIEENYLGQPYQTSENILPVETMMIQPLSLNSDMNQINLPSDESGDPTTSPNNQVFDYTDDTTSGEPNTPPANGEQVHPESKCYNNSPNNVSQHTTPIVTTTAAPEFFYDSCSPYYNVMDGNFTMNTMNTMNFSLPPTTTSPTDDSMASWN
ncbi:hypothetical protein RclHR1_04370001 [Rhizophagus clarus]|uniref:Zn(2)-C6 fungal-type domain-containing protein n=1 Tax=Rhizophagus clarus TaxID=94130 RepID=A0A2Z6RY67_9GLOM|nr:hypothetical protein RclHR1_04370001 [Rhizophagus clarus]GES94633.1 hypothetical protein GLOIN_2v1571975 [Rhizophagus clarus]